jgi:hypothetical protein
MKHETPNKSPVHMHCLTFGASAFRQLLSVLLDIYAGFLLLHALRASFV